MYILHPLHGGSCYGRPSCGYENGVKLHDGTPREIFSHVDTLKGLGLDVPVASEIAFKLNAKGYEVGKSIINNEELAKGL